MRPRSARCGAPGSSTAPKSGWSSSSGHGPPSPGGWPHGCRSDSEGGGSALTVELHEALGPLAPFLAPAGSEAVLLRGARIALADGPYTPGEGQVLAAVGGALLLCREDTERLLAAAARTPS